MDCVPMCVTCGCIWKLQATSGSFVSLQSIRTTHQCKCVIPLLALIIVQSVNPILHTSTVHLQDLDTAQQGCSQFIQHVAGMAACVVESNETVCIVLVAVSAREGDHTSFACYQCWPGWHLAHRSHETALVMLAGPMYAHC